MKGTMYARKQEISELFIEVYKAYPASFIDRKDVEKTNSIILPSSALAKLSNLNRAFGSESSPIIFRIMNIELSYSTHCGVLDFTAEEDTCYLPLHMFHRLCLTEGMMINLRNVVLDKGSFIKFKPHKTEFVMNPNPKVILENALRQYVCITKNDTITIEFNKKLYLLDVVECKPKDTICLTNVDVTVDFDVPVDYKEAEQKMKQQQIQDKQIKKPLTEEDIINKVRSEKFQGNCLRVDGKKITENQAKNIEEKNKKQEEEDMYDPRKHRITHGVRNSFIAFKGQGSKVGK